ncbi:MAG TPA: hypothetical protein VGN60_06370 [Devosia sp.]|jgi:hypothetical protein|nr:hypothetical protein [Devosia sp.]
MSVLLGAIIVFAVLTFAVAAMQAVIMVRTAPSHENLAGFLPLGWWKFRQIEAKAGPGASQPLNIYKRAVIAFVVFVLLGLILSGWAINRDPVPTDVASQPRLINDPRVIPAQFAIITDNRRVASMPGAQSVES